MIRKLLYGLVIASLTLPVLAADTRSISSLPNAAVPLAGTEQSLIVQSGVTKKFAPTPFNINALGTANNLSDLTNTTNARNNLGLGTAAVKDIGTSGDALGLLNTANVWSAAQTFSPPVSVASGGTGITFGTSGGIPYFSASGTIASSAALTANRPVFGGGAGVAPFVGTRHGNTTDVATVTGATTNGNIAKWDANGNLIDGGAAGSGTVTSVTCGTGLSGGAITTTGTCSVTYPTALAQKVCSSVVTHGTTTSLIPLDDTIPQVGEGAQITTVTLSPKNSLGTLIISAQGLISNTVADNGVILAVFRDGAANAVAATATTIPAASTLMTVNLNGSVAATATSSTTFSIRIGGQAASTTSWNGAGGRTLGGVSQFLFCVEEILP